MSRLDKRPPVLLLGGLENSLAIARSLGRKGIKVSVSAVSRCLAPRSRYCHRAYPVPPKVDAKTVWEDLLLGKDNHALDGHVLLACNDDSLEFLAEHRDDLKQRYLIDHFKPELIKAMLDKQRTLELARTVGVPTPGFWAVNAIEDVAKIEPEIRFPAIIKPIHSHVFQRAYDGKKYLPANDADELRRHLDDTLKRGIRVMVCELIPGPDTLLSSYYTYLDQQGTALFHFTKRVFRRFPVNHGGASYHITEWLPETAELGERFFRGIDYLGLANIEFKRDPRDGTLKVIECNVRFTAAHELLVRCGMDTAEIVYNHLTGSPLPDVSSYKEHVRLLSLLLDIHAFRQLSGRGELTFWQWLHSIAHKQSFPKFSLTDPWPALSDTLEIIGNKLLRR